MVVGGIREGGEDGGGEVWRGQGGEGGGDASKSSETASKRPTYKYVAADVTA